MMIRNVRIIRTKRNNITSMRRITYIVDAAVIKAGLKSNAGKKTVMHIEGKKPAANLQNEQTLECTIFRY